MTRQKRACVNSSFFGWRFHSKLYDTASSKGPLPFTMINAWRISRLNPGSDASRQKSTKTSDVVLAAKKKARTINCCRCHYSNYVMTNQKTCWIMQKSCLSHKTHPFLCWIMLEEWNKGCNSDSCLHIIPRRLHETRVHGHRNKCAAWANLITVRAHYVNIRKGQVAKSLYSNLATHVTCNTQHFPKSSSESFIDKVFLKTLGQTSVALQQYGPKGFAILYLSLSFSRFCRTLWDNETEKRGTMSKAGHGGFLFTSLYIIYNELCQRYASIQNLEKYRPISPPWPFHWVFPAPGQLSGSTFQLVTMSNKQSPKVPLALSVSMVRLNWSNSLWKFV